MGFSDSYPRSVRLSDRGYQSVVMPPDYRMGRDNVRKNETLRLLLQDYAPSSTLTDDQAQMFGGSAYANDSDNAKRSILARGASGDPSARMSFEQDAELRKLRSLGNLLGGY